MPITWLDKIDGFDLGNPQKNVNAADMNQIKNVANATETAAAAAQANIDSHEALTNNPHGVTKAQVGLSNVENISINGAITAAIDALIGGAPGALDTLNELAAALGDDASFSTAVTNALALKAPLASPTFTGLVTTPLIKITGGSPGANKFLVSDADGDASWGNVPVGSISGVLPIANGGNGTSTGISNETQTALNLKITNTHIAKGVTVSGTINGVGGVGNMVFTIGESIVSGSEDVFLNGSRQTDGIDYGMTFPGGVPTITFIVFAPETGSILRVNFTRP